MSTTITETAVPQTIQATAPIIPKPSGPNRLFANPGKKHGDWRDEIEENGFTVVKGAIPRERADKYADDVFTYLETLYDHSLLLSQTCLTQLQQGRSRIQAR